MIFSRFLVSDGLRFSIPSRWLSDLARRGSLSYPTGQEPYKGKHLVGKRCPDCGGMSEVCRTHGNVPCPMSPQFCEVVWCPTCGGSGEAP